MTPLFTVWGRARKGVDIKAMEIKSKSAYKSMQVVLGSQTIKAFVASPREFKVIGIVRMGMEFGLLARTASGLYVRVNGSIVEALNQHAVQAAIDFACATGRGESYAASRGDRVPAPPTVVVRKRRHYGPSPVQPLQTLVCGLRSAYSWPPRPL